MADPRIEFPCSYPIKVMGEARPGFRRSVLDIVRKYDEGVQDDEIAEKLSKKGKYVSLTVWLWATGEDQLSRIFTDLKKSGLVKLVL